MIGRIIDVDGVRHWVKVEGTGRPVVVFESAIGDVGLTWGLVQPGISETTTTFAHDRPGLGASDSVSGPRVASSMVEELRGALASAALKPPYVLVGHSFASLTVRAFAHRFPGEVVGLVLVDGAHEDQTSRFPPELDSESMLAGVGPQLRELAREALGGETVPVLTPVPEDFPETLADAYREATAPTPSRLESAAGEYDGLPQSQEELRELSVRGHGNLPLLVLRHGVPQPMTGVSSEVNQRYEETWRQLQFELAARSTRGDVRVADGAGHMIHHERPDLVINAIRDAITRAQTD